MLTQKLVLGIACSISLVLFLASYVRRSTEELEEEKSELRQQMQTSISKIDEEVDRLQRNHDSTQAGRGKLIQLEIDTLNQARTDLCDKVSDFGDASQEDWNRFHAEAMRSLDHARKALAETGVEVKL